MTEIEYRPTGYEQQVIRLLAKHYHEESDEFRIDNLPPDGLTREDILNVVRRFERYRLVEPATNEAVRILPALLDAATQLDSPPIKDYWAGITRWFRSRWWSVLVLLVVVSLPLLVQWVQMLKTLLQWLGILK